MRPDTTLLCDRTQGMFQQEQTFEGETVGSLNIWLNPNEFAASDDDSYASNDCSQVIAGDPIDDFVTLPDILEHEVAHSVLVDWNCSEEEDSADGPDMQSRRSPILFPSHV